jgi:hypothetical protein
MGSVSDRIQQAELRCRICKCSPSRPCVTSDGGTCAWSAEDETLCNFCEVTAAHLAQWILVQDYSRRPLTPDLTARLLEVAGNYAATVHRVEDEPRVIPCTEGDADVFLRAHCATGGPA